MPDRVEDTIAQSRVRALLESKGGTKVDIGDGNCYYVMPNESVVRMPDGHARLPESQVQIIAGEKAGMEMWEYDYWLGQQDRGNH